MRPPFDYNAYSKRLEDLFIRLKSAGVRVENTRLDAYRKAIVDFDKVANKNRLREWASTEKIALLYNDLEESHEILEACDQFDDLTKPGLLTRLEKVFSGQRVLGDETSEKAEARNVLFELVVAARLKKAGFEVDLDRIVDIRFPLWDRPCFAECKRIRSANLLKRRIQEAADQVGRRCDGAGTSSARGIIAIDVSKIESRDDFLLVCRADEEVGLEVRRHLDAFIHLHRDAFQSACDREKRALAIYAYLRLPAAVLGQNGLWVAKTACVYLLHHSQSQDGKLTLRFQERIQPARIPEHRRS